jgi:NADH-quinone oxidoreductase subunit N
VIAADTLQGPAIDWFALSPLLILLGGGLLLLVVGALTRPWPRGLYAFVCALCAGSALVMSTVLWDDITDNGARTLVGDAIAFDAFSMFVTIAICLALVLVSMLTSDYLAREDLDGPEVYALYLMAAIGAIVMSAANDLLVMFLGLEVLSLALYTLAASHRRRLSSQESGLKYFLLGGFASAFFLYGVALIYGAAGSTNIGEIVREFSTRVQTERTDALALAGIALLLVGLAFKVAAVPFHVWTPDVYQGAPSPVTAFMASVGKAAAFAAMLRVLVYALPAWRDDWRPAVWVLAALTVVIGSTLAVVQTDVKRMLAFSSISHAGFLLVGVEAAGHTAGETEVGTGVSSTLLYLMIYGVMVVGTFAVVGLVGRTGDGATDIGAFRGLGRSRPLLAVGMTVLLLAQAGMPVTSGFVAKFGVIKAAVEEESWALAVIAMVASVIAAFVYLRIMISMWAADPEIGDDARESVQIPLASGLAIAAAVGFTLVVGVAPGWLVSASENATALMRGMLP